MSSNGVELVSGLYRLWSELMVFRGCGVNLGSLRGMECVDGLPRAGELVWGLYGAWS